MSADEREALLWGEQAEKAEVVVDYFVLLSQLRAMAAEAERARELGDYDRAGVCVEGLVTQILRVDPDHHEAAGW